MLCTEGSLQSSGQFPQSQWPQQHEIGQDILLAVCYPVQLQCRIHACIEVFATGPHFFKPVLKPCGRREPSDIVELSHILAAGRKPLSWIMQCRW